MAINLIYFIYATLLICNLFNLQAVEPTVNHAVYNQTRNEDFAADAIHEIIANPYSSPKYLFQQVHTVKTYVERYRGTRFDIRQLVLEVNENLKRGSKGWEIPTNQLNAILNFVERERPYFEFNKMMLKESADFDFHVENFSVVVDCYNFPFNYYDVHEVIDEVHQCQVIAKVVIEEVPPRVTFAVACGICGKLMSYTPYGKVAMILQEAAAFLLIESTATSCERQNGEKNVNPQNNSPPKPQTPFWVRK